MELVSRDGAAISSYMFPPPPTLFLDIRTVARTLCEFLLRRIQGEPAEALQRILPCELRYSGLLRESADEQRDLTVFQFGSNAEPVPNPVLQAASLPQGDGFAATPEPLS